MRSIIIVFGSRDTKQYVEINKCGWCCIAINWVNYPISTCYYREVFNTESERDIINKIRDGLKDCNDIMQARNILDKILVEPSIRRNAEEINNLQNIAFDKSRGTTDDYFTGMFDALSWVLGDELDKEIWG